MAHDSPAITQTGHFHRPEAAFRSFISRATDSDHPPAKDRYVLYISLGCPWAHRTNIVRRIKGLESVIEMVVLDPERGPEGWYFSGRFGTAEKDPLYGFKTLKELYVKASPSYNGRFSVPVLWDKQRETVVNNESSEIIRMFYTEFDDLLPPQLRESGHPATNGCGFYPEELRSKIDAMNEWIYQYINNGVYRTGFAATQQAYEDGVYPLFKALDRVEKHLAEPQNQPYLFGEHITETDIRLYTTIARFDVAYYLIFKCNLKMIRHDYPNIDKWYRNLYWDESEKTRGAFKLTTDFQMYKLSYLNAVGRNGVIPAGPEPDILPPASD
ncbi:conserved hypothetical protein [Talaromyces stipitatus ATCC 10500]|uniref:GST C-terminal domain-containing protein n=1 Tax=Talaromyces stipitatus (strain ATCC 10500 / CBS 375.48 / QM 6759 / NRRL 1006) TaxID=441959 RepID=B8LXC4_TALSN|nr:uncharacterized protein TSTA_066520 [Talaromyces stipitatus ATCC 10500]EED23205.1 conserved hypothetical protein [Talaromyces stipitatus ATCC 10500]